MRRGADPAFAAGPRAERFAGYGCDGQVTTKGFESGRREKKGVRKHVVLEAEIEMRCLDVGNAVRRKQLCNAAHEFARVGDVFQYMVEVNQVVGAIARQLFARMNGKAQPFAADVFCLLAVRFHKTVGIDASEPQSRQPIGNAAVPGADIEDAESFHPRQVRQAPGHSQHGLDVFVRMLRRIVAGCMPVDAAPVESIELLLRGDRTGLAEPALLA